MTGASLSSAGAVTASSISTGGSVTAASLSASGDLTSRSASAGTLTVTDSAAIAGSLQLGASSTVYSIGRVAGSAAGRSTVLIGQAGAIGNPGGDLVLDAGTGSASGSVVIGLTAASITMGRSGKTTTVLGGVAAAALTVSGPVTASSLSSGGVLTSAGLSSSGPVTSSAISASGTVTARGSMLLAGSMQLGDDSMFTISRTVYSLSSNARSTFVLGQPAGHQLSSGGDLILDAGTGATAGTLRLGTASGSVLIGSLLRTTQVAGSLVANTASVSGLMKSAAVSATGSLTATSAEIQGALTAQHVRSSGTLSVAGSSQLVGNVALGADIPFTIGRAVQTTVFNGRSTVIVGQGAGHPSSAGGNLVLEGGTGAVIGSIRIGTASESVVISQSGKTTTVRGDLVAQAGSVTGSLTAGSMSSAGPLTAATISSAARSSSGGMTSSAPVTASSFSTAGALTANGITTGAAFTAASLGGYTHITQCARQADLTVAGTSLLQGSVVLVSARPRTHSAVRHSLPPRALHAQPI